MALLSLLCLSGCGTLNRMQFAVTPPPPEPGRAAPTLTQADYAMVHEILRETAKSLNLTDRTATSMVPGTLVYYQATDSDDPIKLIAWKQDNRILVDFMHVSEGGLGETLTFRQARERLSLELETAFGPRLKTVPFGKLNSP